MYKLDLNQPVDSNISIYFVPLELLFQYSPEIIFKTFQ